MAPLEGGVITISTGASVLHCCWQSVAVWHISVSHAVVYAAKNLRINILSNEQSLAL